MEVSGGSRGRGLLKERLGGWELGQLGKSTTQEAPEVPLGRNSLSRKLLLPLATVSLPRKFPSTFVT